MTQMTANNPLAGAFRKPKSWVRLLGTDIGAYPEGFITADNEKLEVGVKPMTGSDETLLNNPDGLLNGESIVSVIKSCCPTISDPTKLLHIDIRLLMTEIRRNSYGKEHDIDETCPKCGHVQKKTLDLDMVLSNVRRFSDGFNVVELDGDLEVMLHPYDFSQYKKILDIGYKESKSLRALSPDSGVSDDERLAVFSKMYKEMSTLNRDILMSSIASVSLAGNVVTEPQFITEFFMEIDRESSAKIKEKVDDMNNHGVQSKLDTKCQNCQHEHIIDVNFDQMSFFTRSSDQATHNR
tara:strand:+ start:22449 stop:23333 length:885 start_codon:yes stop_codon:yes gene_type:complete